MSFLLKSKLAAPCCLSLASGILAAASADDCNGVPQTGPEVFAAIERNELSESLSTLVVNYGPVFCQRFDRGPDAAEVCKGLSPPVVPIPALPNAAWEGLDFEWDLLSFVLTEENYNHCRDIFSDNRLQKALASIEGPSQEVVEKFKILGMRQQTFLVDGEPTSGNDNCTVVKSETIAEVTTTLSDCEPLTSSDWRNRKFDETQEKLFSVFDRVQSWNYCASPKWRGKGRALGLFDADEYRISIYYGACTAVDLYGTELGKLTAAHRAWLIAAHEFGHAIDASSSNEDKPKDWSAQEARATLYGSYFAECGARLLKEMGIGYAKIVTNHPSASYLDRKFVGCQTRYWERSENYIRRMRQNIDEDAGLVPVEWQKAQYGLSFHQVPK